MRILKARFPLLLLLLTLSALPMSAAVYVVPPDEQMIEEADAIIVGRVTAMNGEFDLKGNINTMVDLDVSQVLKGDPVKTMRIRVPGGVVGSQFMGVSDGPVFWEHERTLLFLQSEPNGGYTTYGLALGKFDFVVDAKGDQLAVRWALQGDSGSWDPNGLPHEEGYRLATGFMNFIRNWNAGKTMPKTYFVRDPGPITPGSESVPTFKPGVNAFPASAYTQGNYRWDIFDKGGSTTFYASGSQPGYDSIGAAQRALAAWTNDPASNVVYVYGGTNTRGFVQDGVNTMVLNSANDVPTGAIGYAQWYGNAQHNYKGEVFVSISEGDVAIKSNFGFSQTVYDEALTHELGHTLGFRHSDQGTPASNDAVMKAVLNGTFGANLQSWDREALAAVYGSSAAPPAKLATFSADQSFPQTEGTPITWTATATAGTTPYLFRWWIQNNGSWTLMRDYSTSNTFTWTPPPGSSGTHGIEVDVKSTGSTRDYEDTSNFLFGIVPYPRIVSLTANPSPPVDEGTTITWTATATGGVSPLLYRWWLQSNGSWVQMTGYTANNTFTWTAPAGSAGQHAVEVDVLSYTSNRDHDVVASQAFTIAAPVVISSLTPNKPFPQPVGATIVWTATASGGSPPLLYRFWVETGGHWGIVQDYSTSNTYTYTATPGSQGQHGIEVDVKSSNSLRDHDAVKMNGFTIR